MNLYSVCDGCKDNQPESDKCTCISCKRCYIDTDEEKYNALPDQYETV